MNIQQALGQSPLIEKNLIQGRSPEGKLILITEVTYNNFPAVYKSFYFDIGLQKCTLTTIGKLVDNLEEKEYYVYIGKEYIGYADKSRI